jgi:hypothetical protein
LAKKVRHVEAEEGGNKRIRAFADELKSGRWDPYDGEFINTGISIPFYGATKVGLITQERTDEWTSRFIINKLQKKYNKYE